MRRIIILIFSLGLIYGCVNKHPYNYEMDNSVVKPGKLNYIWQIEAIDNSTSLPMAPTKQANLTNEIYSYMNNQGFNTKLLNGGENKGNSVDKCDNCIVVKPKIIQVMAEISSNTAGWHGTSEDPLDFWSHFSPGRSFQTIEGSLPALSLLIEIKKDNMKYYENAGGIELVGKYNKFSGQLRTKEEMVSDIDAFKEAIIIALRPLIDALR